MHAVGTKTLTERVRGLKSRANDMHVVAMWDEEKLQEEAGAKHGLIARPDLISHGVTNRQIAGRVALGRLTVLHPGVYYFDSTPATWKTVVLAAVLAAGPDALASHRCAGVLWELDAIYGRVIEVTVPYVESPEPEGVIVHRTRRINPMSVVEAIPVTTVERTLFDLAPMVPERTLEKAARSAVHQRLTTPEKLDFAVAEFGSRGVAGTKKVRSVVRTLDTDQSGSVAEIDLKYIVLDAPIPMPVQQLQISLHDGTNAYPDFSWPDRMRIVEIDGFGAHGTPEQQQNDLRRQNALMDLGWDIRRFTATEVRLEPDRVRSEIIRFVNRPVP